MLMNKAIVTHISQLQELTSYSRAIYIMRGSVDHNGTLEYQDEVHPAYHMFS